MILKKGNNKIFVFAIKNTDGNLLAHLAEAIAIKFMVKQYKTDLDSAALISKNLTNGIKVNYPYSGYIQIEISSTDSENIITGEWWAGLQIEFSSTNKVEVDIKENMKIVETLEITQDVIR